MANTFNTNTVYCESKYDDDDDDDDDDNSKHRWLLLVLTHDTLDIRTS